MRTEKHPFKCHFIRQKITTKNGNENENGEARKKFCEEKKIDVMSGGGF